MRRSLAVLAGAPLLLATTCIERYELRASPRPERGKPAITAWRGDRPVVVNGLTVQRCRPAALPHVAWSISRKEFRDSTAAPEPIIYGELPKGFAETHAPEPLAPATCYALVGGGGAVDGMGLRFGMGHGGFHVREDGSVVPGEAGFGESTHYERQFSRAAIACRRALRHARTPGQLAAVDARTSRSPTPASPAS